MIDETRVSKLFLRSLCTDVTDVVTVNSASNCDNPVETLEPFCVTQI